MRITDLRLTPIALGDPPLLNAAGLHAPYCLRTVVELMTDVGIHGIAEVPGSQATNRAMADASAVVLGADPLNSQALKGALRERLSVDIRPVADARPWDHGSFVQVMSAIEIACLDIAGKAFGVPAATLLGGAVRDRVPYCGYLFYKYEGAGGPRGFGTDSAATGWAAARQREALDPDAIVEQARAMVAEFGFRSLKLKGGVFEPRKEAAAIRALRKAFGPGMPLRLDPNALWSVETSVTWGRDLEDVLEYLEDPTSGQEAMAAVRSRVKVPLATNMCTTSFEALPGSVRLGSEDIILTDPHYWGGLRASMELGAVCRVFGRGISMHSNNHAGISLAAMTQLGAALPNLSFALDTHYPWQSEDVIVGGRMTIEDGCVRLPGKPGLGVELDREALARAHTAFAQCGLTDRDDARELQKKVPGWAFQSPRW